MHVIARAFRHKRVLRRCPTFLLLHLMTDSASTTPTSLAPNMARYTVKVAAGGRTASLLIVLSPSQLCSALLDTVKNRLPTLTTKLALTNVDQLHITLHLDAEDGPMLDLEDLLSDVLPDPKETVYAVINVSHPGHSLSIASPLWSWGLSFQIATLYSQGLFWGTWRSFIIILTKLQAQEGISDTSALCARPALDGQTLRIRVITPESARSCSGFDSIAPLSRAVSLNCTLKELKGVVQQHLGFPADDGVCPELECNCSFARQIDNNTVFNVRGVGDYEALRTVIVVHGANNVVAVPISDPTLSVIHQATKDHLSQHMTNKVLRTIGGVEDKDNQVPGIKRFLKPPVLAVCSKQRHTNHRRQGPEDSQSTTSQRDLIVDIHTSECPVEVTAHNADITLAASGLEDYAINGTLDIFAVQRWSLAQGESPAQGKAGIFAKSEAWEHHIGETDRGISNLLSTLRVFTDLTAGSNMEDTRQDAVLHVIHLLTRFPPAVRAAYILMRGETPRLSERAALAQCLYEVLKTVVPLQTVRSDPKRLFEGSRLLFGLILEKAKNLKVSTLRNQSELPYVSMKVYDLRNMITMDPVLSVPVQTPAGLVDLGFFEAFIEGGLLTWTNHTTMIKSSAIDRAWSRIAAISGGATAQVVGFNADMIGSSSHYADGGDINKVISPTEYTDLQYLANLCSRNQLTVTPPAALASASAPVLTLDREGSLAVYVGRAGCGAEPGRDILMFRPTSGSEEEGVDVSIITQLLEPILAQRTADGTIVFEAYGDHHRKMIAPDEITMLCVDLSCSMSDRCGFTDVQINEDADAQINRNARTGGDGSTTRTTENPAYHLPDTDELKEYLKAHESYDDFIAIISTAHNDYHRRQNAEKVLQIIQQLDEQQIEAKRKELETLRRKASHFTIRTRADNMERELNILKNRSLRLQKHKNLLCAWFLTCVGKQASSPDTLIWWKPGDAVPKVYKAPQQAGSEVPKFEIPREYCCHISNEVMEDPVITVDNYTYERKNIERWFQTNETSPLTNLVLPSLDLRPNVQKKEEIVAFLNSSDITSRYMSLRGSSNAIRVSLKSPLETWSMLLPRSLKLKELWEIAFRMTKGRYMSYELQHRNGRVPPSQESIFTVINTDHAVFIMPLETTTSSNTNTGTEELCLVKVYGDSYAQPDLSYWEPKHTTKSLASAVFRYYRQKFTLRSTTPVESPFVFWTRLHDRGDNHCNGTIVYEHWKPISQFFNRTDSTGKLALESCVDKLDDEGLEAADTWRDGGGDRPYVFKLCLGAPPRSGKSRDNTLSRLDVLKQMFDAFINRVLAYNFQTHVGLVTFGTKASVSQSITHAVENFRHKLNNMTAAGDTAIWDSLALAQDQLQHYAKKYPKAKLRIICISDGEDNKSKHTARGLASDLSYGNIVVDSVCLGDAENDELKTLSYLTGGYTFEPKNLEEAMAICEMEPVLSLLERPELNIQDNDEGCRTRFRANPTIHNFQMANRAVSIERVTRDHCPDRKEHVGLRESFVELGTLSKHASQNRTDNNLRLSRIHNEIRNSGAKLHPHYDIFICESNMGLWKVVMQGRFSSLGL